jgi:hypothetical protein
VIEKSKNDQKRKTPYRKIATYGCGMMLLVSIACLGLAVYALREVFKDGFAMGPGPADYCRSTEGVDYDFKLSGRVVDAQSQPINLAQVEIGSERPASCLPEATSYSTTTNENGEFSFGPILFGYGDEFFIAVSIEGCSPSILYDDLPDDEPVTIVLDCATSSTP